MLSHPPTDAEHEPSFAETALKLGGKSDEEGELAAYDPDGMQEGQPVRVFVGPEHRLMHEPPDRSHAHAWL